MCIRDRSFGNLILAALNGISDSFDQAVARMSEVLAISGRVLPVTNENVALEATFENGTRVLGESKISAFKKEQDCRIESVRLLPEHPKDVYKRQDLDTTWATVSWETVVERAPEVIIINDYGDTSLEEKIAQLKENPALATVPAIQNDRIISVTLCESFASSMTGDTVEKFARAFPVSYTHLDVYKRQRPARPAPAPRRRSHRG